MSGFDWNAGHVFIVFGLLLLAADTLLRWIAAPKKDRP